ncbi:hypothetical protein CCMA1212_004511 [Trichoderma ghanense]|uniref:Uncharacterized protein n=1 Tax=Trichoderma ghanense TaxID=65468 RepID=A0ABY2H8D2_9HYPO
MFGSPDRAAGHVSALLFVWSGLAVHWLAANRLLSYEYRLRQRLAPRVGKGGRSRRSPRQAIRQAASRNEASAAYHCQKLGKHGFGFGVVTVVDSSRRTALAAGCSKPLAQCPAVGLRRFFGVAARMKGTRQSWKAERRSIEPKRKNRGPCVWRSGDPTRKQSHGGATVADVRECVRVLASPRLCAAPLVVFVCARTCRTGRTAQELMDMGTAYAG